MDKNATRPPSYNQIRGVCGITASAATLALVFLILCAVSASAGDTLQKCFISGPAPMGCAREPISDGPSCGLEITCTDRPVQLGYTDGVCFRATCPGIWALIHQRVDQASFRRRFLTYRHYSFVGHWELKDQGLIESGPVRLRELFLVLPDDLIEFKLRDPDCNAAIEVRNLGYIKKGSPNELKHWLAYNVYLERPEQLESVSGPSNCRPFSGPCPNGPEPLANRVLGRILSLGRCIGLPNRP